MIEARFYSFFGPFGVEPEMLAIFLSPFLIYFAATYFGFKTPNWLKVIAYILGIPWVFMFFIIFSSPIDTTNRRESTKTTIMAIEAAMCGYKLECGRFPDSLESLEQLAKVEQTPTHNYTDCEFAARGYIKAFRYRDAWKRPFIYDFNQLRPAIISLGSDGIIGGEDSKEDIVQEVDCSKSE